MSDTLFLIGLICAAIAGALFVASVVMFFAFDIPAAVKLSRGKLSRKDVDRARDERIITISRIPAMPVAASAPAPVAQAEVVRSGTKKINDDFIIEKSIVFVSTDEIM